MTWVDTAENLDAASQSVVVVVVASMTVGVAANTTANIVAACCSSTELLTGMHFRLTVDLSGPRVLVLNLA